MIDLLFFLISRLNNTCSPLVINLQINKPIWIKDIFILFIITVAFFTIEIYVIWWKGWMGKDALDNKLLSEKKEDF